MRLSGRTPGIKVLLERGAARWPGSVGRGLPGQKASGGAQFRVGGELWMTHLSSSQGSGQKRKKRSCRLGGQVTRTVCLDENSGPGGRAVASLLAAGASSSSTLRTWKCRRDGGRAGRRVANRQ